MNDSQIQELLAAMDEAVLPQMLRPNLASVIRRRARRSALIARSSIAAALAIVCSVAVLFQQHKPSTVVRLESQPDRWRTEVEQINAEASRQEQLIARLQKIEASPASQRRQFRDPQVELSADRAAAAGILIFRATQLEQNHSIPQAIAQYQHVIDLFAGTPQANLAEDRMRRIKTSSSIDTKLLYSGATSCNDLF